MTAKDDEEVISIEKEVYFKMFWKIGGFILLVPYILAISVFSYLEIYRYKHISKWANKVAKEQHEEFFNSCLTVFAVTLLSSGLIVVKVHLNAQMKMNTSR